MVMGRQNLIAFLLQLPDLGLDSSLVDPHHLMMSVHGNAQGLAEGNQQMVFVQLGIALHRLVLDAFGDFPELRRSFAFQLLKGVSRSFDPPY